MSDEQGSLEPQDHEPVPIANERLRGRATWLVGRVVVGTLGAQVLGLAVWVLFDPGSVRERRPIGFASIQCDQVAAERVAVSGIAIGIALLALALVGWLPALLAGLGTALLGVASGLGAAPRAMCVSRAGANCLEFEVTRVRGSPAFVALGVALVVAAFVVARRSSTTSELRLVLVSGAVGFMTLALLEVAYPRPLDPALGMRDPSAAWGVGCITPDMGQHWPL